MLTSVFLIISVLVFAGLAFCAVAGLRNGDRPGDARLTARLETGTQPDEARPLILVTVQNPSPAPVLAALAARRR